MEVGTAIDIYTTVLGWTLFDRIWEALTDTGIAFLPFFGALARHFVKHWGEAGDAGAEASIRGLELDLIGMATVAALAGAPVLEVKIADLSHTAACGTTPVQGGATGTLYDSTFALGGDTALVPVWWRAVMAVAAGLSNVAIAATPCQTHLRQLDYRLDNRRIEVPVLRYELQLFGQDCFGPARAKFARELQSLPAGYAPGDVDWPGSKFFLDTSGYYDDPNPNLARRASEPIPGFPYDAARDAEYETAPVSGLGKPTCRQWWSDATAGLRKRLLDQIDPDALSRFATWFTAQYAGKSVTDAQDEQIRALFEREVKGRSAGASAEAAWWEDRGELGSWVLKGLLNLPATLGTVGTAYHAVEQRATFYALQQAAPIGQSLILMAIYLCLPFVLVFSGYSIETVLLAGLGIFAVRFCTALWALATWVDSALVEALGIEWWKVADDEGIARLVAQMVGSLLFVGLPVVWFLVLGWAGHHLAASGLAGGLSEGIGRAAGGGVRAGGKLARGAAGKMK